MLKLCGCAGVDYRELIGFYNHWFLLTSNRAIAPMLTCSESIPSLYDSLRPDLDFMNLLGRVMLLGLRPFENRDDIGITRLRSN